jgi:hypothetical protein
MNTDYYGNLKLDVRTLDYVYMFMDQFKESFERESPANSSTIAYTDGILRCMSIIKDLRKKQAIQDQIECFKKGGFRWTIDKLKQ